MKTEFIPTLEISNGFQFDSNSIELFLFPLFQGDLGGLARSFLAGGDLKPTTRISVQTTDANRWHYSDTIKDFPHQPIERYSKNLNLLRAENCFQASRTPPEASGLNPAKASSK